MREQWRVSAMQNMDSHCILSNLVSELAVPMEDYFQDDPILYCGNVSREPRTVQEAQAIRKYLLLLQLSDSGYIAVIKTLLDPLQMDESVQLDRRFRHYLHTLLWAKGDREYKDGDVGWMESRQMLSPDEREAVETAALRGDMNAVLQMLPECRAE